MPDYADAEHRPHAIHTGEEPRIGIDRGPTGLKVTLDTWGPQDNLFPAMYDALQSNWGDTPSRTVDAGYVQMGDAYSGAGAMRTGWTKLRTEERAYVEACFAGRTLPQILELITFQFTVDGCTRAFTHEFVRARIGSGFMQHGGRDNDWRHRRWTMPETLARAIDAYDAKQGHDAALRAQGCETDEPAPYPTHVGGAAVCVTDWAPIERYMDENGLHGREGDLYVAISDYVMQGKRLYAALVDSGIPWQDARRLLHIGTQTYIHGVFNYVALKAVLANRLEHVMDWEINCVAQLMLREINMKCPPIFGRYLGSHSDMAKQARFAGLESWPPDGKYPNPHEQCENCSHKPHPNGLCPHTWEDPIDGRAFGCLCDRYKAQDLLPRTHRREQMPFWVLTPLSLSGHAPVSWIQTNGSYPTDMPAR